MTHLLIICAVVIMYVPNSLVEKLSLVVTEEDNEGESDDWTISTSTDPDFLSSTLISTDPPISSSTGGSTGVTSPGGEDGEDDGSEKKWVLPVVISLGCLLLIVGVVIIVVICRRRKCFGLPLPFIKRKFHLAQPIKKLAGSVRSSISSTFSSSGGSILGRDGNKQFRKYAVRLDKRFEEGGGGDNVDGAILRGRDLDGIIGEKDFSGEFEAVKRADLKDILVTAALKPENFLKNRFSNVLPYDKTRVVLTGEVASGNDYVNANYVSGYSKENEFICTQGPLKQTVQDFWRMCWETRAVAIVMLTKCYEKNQEKCHPYWPSGNTGYSTFGDIKVTLERKTTWRLKGSKLSEEPDLGRHSQKEHLWQVSELKMEKVGENEAIMEHRSIIHIVFLSWPDFGVVDPPSSLISFVKNVHELVRKNENNNNNEIKRDPGPILVHCSAGVGRSGVYIAVDQLIQQFEEFNNEDDPQNYRNKSVNIFRIVAKMRTERMGMVQNLQQYTLIYKCLQVLVSKKLGNSKHENEPCIVSNDVIQGSDWGLIYPETNPS